MVEVQSQNALYKDSSKLLYKDLLSSAEFVFYHLFITYKLIWSTRLFGTLEYRPTANRTGMTCIQWLWSFVIARDQKLISRPKPFDIRAILFYRVQRFPFWKKWQTETVPPKSVCSKVTTRDSPRFFDQVGHQTTNACIGNKYFFT